MTPDLFGASPLETMAAIVLTGVVSFFFLAFLIVEVPLVWHACRAACRSLFQPPRSNVVPFPARRVDDRAIHDAIKQVVGRTGKRP